MNWVWKTRKWDKAKVHKHDAQSLKEDGGQMKEDYLVDWKQEELGDQGSYSSAWEEICKYQELLLGDNQHKYGNHQEFEEWFVVEESWWCYEV